MNKEQLSPHEFRIRGITGESFVQSLADRSFLTDWCYRNPSWPDGKELCDLLVVFDDVAVIWSVKTLTPRSDGTFKEEELEKSSRQALGAHRRLFELKKPITLKNPRRGSEAFDPALIRETFLVSAILGAGTAGALPLVQQPREDGPLVHVLSGTFVESVLTELDTIADFIAYLRAKERLYRAKVSVTVAGGEEELLSYYLTNERTLDALTDKTHVFVDEGGWSALQSRPEYRAKKERDRISYGWDSIIDRAHEGSPEYERVARELARPTRLERRMLGQAFWEAYVAAAEDKTHNVCRRVVSADGTTYCFVFVDEALGRESRKKMLLAVVWAARGMFPASAKVIGIATEKAIEETCSYDFLLLIHPELTQEDQHKIAKLREDLGLFKDAKEVRVHEDEYPRA